MLGTNFANLVACRLMTARISSSSHDVCIQFDNAKGLNIEPFTLDLSPKLVVSELIETREGHTYVPIYILICLRTSVQLSLSSSSS